MRILMTVLATGCVLSAGPAFAAEPVVFDTFQKICVAGGSAPDPAKALAEAKALGFSIEARPAGKPGEQKWRAKKTLSGVAFEIYIGSTPTASDGAATGLVHVDCSVMVDGRIPADLAAARQWVALPPDGPVEDGAVEYTFRQTPTGRTPVSVEPGDAERIENDRAFTAGELRRVVLVDRADFSGMMFMGTVLQ